MNKNLGFKKIACATFNITKKVAMFLCLFAFVLTLDLPMTNAKSLKELTSKEASEKAPELKIEPRIEPRLEGHINKHTLGLGIGQTFLLGGFRKHGEDKITLDLLYSYSASYSFDFIAGVHSSSHKFKGKKTETTGLTLGVKGRAFQYDNFSFFGMGGVGFYHPRMTRDVAGVMLKSDSKITFGVNFGAGCDLRLNRHFIVGLLLQYHDPFNIKQEKGPSVEGSYGKFLFTTSYTF